MGKGGNVVLAVIDSEHNIGDDVGDNEVAPSETAEGWRSRGCSHGSA